MRYTLLCLLILAASGSAQSRIDDYAVILGDPPLADQVASRHLMRAAAAQTQLHRIEAAQRSVRLELDRRHIQVVGSVQTLLNAVLVRGSAQQMEQLRGLPGVTGVAWLPPMRHHMDRAPQMINVPAAWNAVGGMQNAGAGVKIAIIDTGIDSTHPAFKDDSLPPPANPPQVPAASLPFTNNKIIMARSYVSMLPYRDDYSPFDFQGWGTAVAAIAAGATTSSPYATTTGVAPKAYLGNYKVFGSPGVNDSTSALVMIKALEDALNDGMDIAVVAFGSLAVYPPMVEDASCSGSLAFDLGIPSDACDVRAQAVERAVRMGMTVVTSAGNDGSVGAQTPTLNTINTPGSAPSAITVGASNNFYSSVGLKGDDVPASLQRIDALYGDGAKLTDPLTAPLRDVSTLGNDGLACSALSPGSLAGAAALMQRGNCAFADKVANAQAAGAVAAVIYLAANDDSIFHPLGLAGGSIPTVMIGNTAGVALKNFIAGQTDRAFTLGPSFPPATGTYDYVMYFSSRGPSIGDASTRPDQSQLAIKPEVVAPGIDIYTATQSVDSNSDVWDPSGYNFFGGTSVAAPLVAGVAALVKQVNPAFTPAQIKSSIVNTASPLIGDEKGQARVSSVGAGKVNAAAAVAAKVSSDPATLSFGVIGDASLPVSLTLRITNSGSDAANFKIGVSRRDPDGNAQVTVAPDNLQLNPGDSGTVAVQLAGSKPAPGSYEGSIIVQNDSTNIHVPYLYLVSDAQPFSIYPLRSAAWDNAGTYWQVYFKLTDQYGVPLWNVPVTWGGDSSPNCPNPTQGCADAVTDRTGIAGAVYKVGTAAKQAFTATAGGLTISFNIVLQ